MRRVIGDWLVLILTVSAMAYVLGAGGYAMYSIGHAVPGTARLGTQQNVMSGTVIRAPRPTSENPCTAVAAQMRLCTPKG